MATLEVKYTRHPLMPSPVKADWVFTIPGPDRVAISAYVIYPRPDEGPEELTLLNECQSVLLLNYELAAHLAERLTEIVEHRQEEEDE